MKITKSQLVQIIKEELQAVHEQMPPTDDEMLTAFGMATSGTPGEDASEKSHLAMSDVINSILRSDADVEAAAADAMADEAIGNYFKTKHRVGNLDKLKDIVVAILSSDDMKEYMQDLEDTLATQGQGDYLFDDFVFSINQSLRGREFFNQFREYIGNSQAVQNAVQKAVSIVMGGIMHDAGKRYMAPQD